jgi:diacylglycerol kinase (ATP)
MSESKSGLKRRFQSFGFAFKGIFELVKSEPNARIHLFATFCALFCGFIFKISESEWCAILIVIGLVWAAEAFNTVVEKLVDHLFPEFHETARVTKDIAAGAVLICAIISVIVGLIIFLPKFIIFFK